jgi:hypothetical protein
MAQCLCYTPGARGSMLHMYEMAGAMKMLTVGDLLTHYGDICFKT